KSPASLRCTRVLRRGPTSLLMHKVAGGFPSTPTAFSATMQHSTNSLHGVRGCQMPSQELVRMKITHPGDLTSRRPPEDYFTGTVWLDPVIEAPAPARLQVARVSFEPGARTAWHTHPLGQT